SEHFTRFSDTDLSQMIAYLKTLPAADMTIEKKRSVGPVGRMVYMFGGLPLLPASMIDRSMSRAAVPEGNTVEYGEYLIATGGCRGCHGDNLGGASMGSTKTPNLSRSGELGKWSEADFAKAIRTGMHPSGRVLSAEMPWPYMKGLTDDEVGAMWKYLQSLTPAATNAGS
ncbi:MAG TPA: c-type cytochrome, partial [Gemmatimonadaceae bacterium]